MGLVKGGFLRLLQTILYFICFCCAAIILGIYSYFLAVQADRDEPIPTWEKAVEGLSGAAVLYTIFAVILTCCLGGVAVFSIIGLVLDLLFAGCMIAIAIMTRSGASSCTGTVLTPISYGDVNDPAQGFGSSTSNTDNVTYAVSNRTACKLNTAAFAVSIVAIVFFIITAFNQLSLIRSHKKEKRYGPSPDNNYTSGKPRRNFWTRKSKKNNLEKDAEMGPTGTAVGAGPTGYRPSHETGSTAVGSGLHNDKLNTTGTAPAAGAHSGYYTQPTGTHNTTANPYGYDNSAPATYTTGTATNY